jgi:hypothetical protein
MLLFIYKMIQREKKKWMITLFLFSKSVFVFSQSSLPIENIKSEVIYQTKFNLEKELREIRNQITQEDKFFKFSVAGSLFRPEKIAFNFNSFCVSDNLIQNEKSQLFKKDKFDFYISSWEIPVFGQQGLGNKIEIQTVGGMQKIWDNFITRIKSLKINIFVQIRKYFYTKKYKLSVQATFDHPFCFKIKVNNIVEETKSDLLVNKVTF